MKAIVLEKRNGLAAVLREDGVIEKVHIACEVGDTVDLPEKKLFTLKKSLGAAAASAAVALMLFTGSHHYLYAAPVSYVTLEASAPSIEFAVNRRGEVIGVEALNDEGKEIVAAYEKAADVGHVTVEKAVVKAVDILCDRGYIGSEEDVPLSLNVASDDETMVADVSEHIKAAVERTVETKLAEVPKITATTASISDRSEAQNKGISTAKLMEEKENKSDGLTASVKEDAQATGSDADVLSGKPQESPAAPAPQAASVTGGNAQGVATTPDVGNGTAPTPAVVKPVQQSTQPAAQMPKESTTGTTAGTITAEPDPATQEPVTDTGSVTTPSGITPPTEQPSATTPSTVKPVIGGTGSPAAPTVSTEDEEEPQIAPEEPVKKGGTGSGTSVVIEAPQESEATPTPGSGVGGAGAMIIGAE